MKMVVDLRCRGLTRARFVELYYESEEFNRAAQRNAGLHERTVLAPETLDDGRIRRRVRVAPEVALPGPLRKGLAGAPITYVEVLTFDADQDTAELEVEGPGRDYVAVRGSLDITERRDQLHFRLRGRVDVNVPLIGGIAERFIAGEVQRRYALLEGFLQEYVDELDG